MEDIDTPKRVIEDIKILISQGCGDETLENRVSNFLQEMLIKNHSDLSNFRLSSDKELIEAARYGYEYHVDTSFPEKSFDDNCLNNVKQWLQAKKEIMCRQVNTVRMKKFKNEL